MTNDGWSKGWLPLASEQPKEAWKPNYPTNSPEFIEKCNAEYDKIFANIPQSDGSTFKLEAIQVGNLLVHSLNLAEGIDWRVTHLPTMSKFDKALPEAIPGKRFGKNKLIDWCREVQLQHRDLWEEIAKYNPENYYDIPTETLDKILDWCQSVVVE